MNNTHYVYLPGLGDGLFNQIRRTMLIGWKLRSIDVSFVALNWADKDELHTAKYNRALMHVKQYEDRKLILIGESAGGSMAIRLFLESDTKIDDVITVCGYNHGAKYIDKRHDHVHPAFIPNVEKVDELLRTCDMGKLGSITSYYSPADGTVGFARTKLKNATLIKLPSLTHVAAIGYFLLATSIRGIR